MNTAHGVRGGRMYSLIRYSKSWQKQKNNIAFKYIFCSKCESTYNGFIVIQNWTIHNRIIKIQVEGNTFILLSLLSVCHYAAQTN